MPQLTQNCQAIYLMMTDDITTFSHCLPSEYTADLNFMCTQQGMAYLNCGCDSLCFISAQVQHPSNL